MKISKLVYTVIFLVSMLQVSYGQGIKVKPGTSVTINTSTTLKVAGGGDLTLEDNQSFSPSLLEKGNLAFAGGGELYVQQYLEKNEWHIISSPVNNETIGVYINMYLYSYNEPTDVWSNPWQTTTPLNVGEGYFIWSVAGAADVVSLIGTSNKTDVNVTLTVTPSTNNSGWNLLGNPFPCVVDWNGDASWAINNVGSTIYLFDAGAGNYKTWNYNGNIGTNGKTDGYIAATQGFWVRTSDTIASQPSYSLTIPASQRVASPSTEFYKEGDNEENMLRLMVNNETYSDECIIAFNENASDGFDNDMDAYKLFSEVPSPKIYSVNGNLKQAVNFMNSEEIHESIPVDFSAGNDGKFTLNISGMESFPVDLPIFLEDKQDGILQDLRETPDYTFQASALDLRDRFVIHFSNPLGIENPTGNMENIRIYSWEKTVKINTPKGFTGTMKAYDLVGKEIASSRITEGLNSIQINALEGYYVVQVIGTEGIKTGKVHIR
ncbi:MAG: hypothetical protein GXO89_16430 [Chlorobi bacterium]|nr:hypothetical protein [Chlorobiota bacterium]